MDVGLTNAARRGFKQSFSAYVSWLIERDAAGDVSRENTVAETSTTPTAPTTKPVKYTAQKLRKKKPPQPFSPAPSLRHRVGEIASPQAETLIVHTKPLTKSSLSYSKSDSAKRRGGHKAAKK